MEQMYDIWMINKGDIRDLFKSIQRISTFMSERNMLSTAVQSDLRKLNNLNVNYWREQEYCMHDNKDFDVLVDAIYSITDKFVELKLANVSHKTKYSEVEEEYDLDYCMLIEMFDDMLCDVKRQLMTMGDGATCPECGQKMYIKWGYKGLFLGCGNFPNCKHCQDYFGKTPESSLAGIFVPSDLASGTSKSTKQRGTVKEDNKINNNEEKKVEGFNMNMDKIFGGKIGRVNEDRFRLSLTGIAIKNNEDSYVTFDGEEVVNVSDFAIDANDIFFRMPSQTVEIGDLIMYHNEPVYVVDMSKSGKTIKVLNALSDKVEEIMPQKSIFGFQFFIKVVSLFNLNGGAPDMSKMMLPLMMMGMKDGGSTSDMMLPMMMMGGMNGEGMDMNSMLPMMMLMGDKKDGKESSMKDMMLPMMMMNGGFGNSEEGGMNPMMLMMMMDGKENNSMMEMMMLSSLFQGKKGVKSDMLGNLTNTKVKGKGGRKPKNEQKVEGSEE